VGGKYHHCNHVFLAAKKRKAGKAAGCNEIQPEMLKALNKGVICHTRVYHVPGVLEWYLKVGELRSSAYKRRETAENAISTVASL